MPTDQPTGDPSSLPDDHSPVVLSPSDLNLAQESQALAIQRHDAHSYFQWVTAFATLLIALATLIVSIVSYLQFRAMRDALIAAQTQTAIAVKPSGVTDATRARLVIDHYALTKPLAIGEIPMAEITIKNTGRSTVRDWHSGFGSAIVADLPEAMPVPDVPDDGELAPGATEQARLVFRTALSADDYARLRSGAVRLYFFGRLSYTTAGAPHHTEFCFTPIPSGPTSQGMVALPCQKWNAAN